MSNSSRELILLHFPGGSKPRELARREAPYKIGRKSENDIVFRDPMVSAHHARLRFAEDTELWVCVDTGSTNGTWLNDKRVSEGDWVPIVEGDRLAFGRKSGTQSWFVVSYSRSTLTPKAGFSADLDDDPPTAIPIPAPVPVSWQVALIKMVDDAQPWELIAYGLLGICGMAIAYWIIKN